MKILLIGINSKFIHPNMAIRYLKANSDFDVDIKEYTIKDNIEYIIKDILIDEPSFIGFSCYIWNISIIKILAVKIKEIAPKTKILFGGPETSYDYDEYLISKIVDFIIINEGEEAFNKLLKALNTNTPFDDIPNLAYLKNDEITRNKQAVIKDLNILKSPYKFKEDILDIPKKVQYVELSRGCPYQCSYCLASLEKGLRFFDISKVFETIDYLVLNGVKTIKFLDRSFNANRNIALQFFKLLVEKDYPKTIFQFEINGDVLHSDIIDYLINNVKKNYIRFELGIQSTNDKVNLAIDRYQNTDILIKNIQKLQTSNVILHLDLIAGLPYENLDSFINTFNRIFMLFSNELQLGFLKMLKGTKIRREAELHDYSYSSNPPYEIIDNKYISKEELELIHKVEIFLEIYWNKGFMNNTIQMIVEEMKNPFLFFKNLFIYFQENNLSYKRYQLFEIFFNLKEYLISINNFNQKYMDSMKLDYLNYHNIKPKAFWFEDIKKQEVIRKFHQANQNFNLDKLYKYSLVTKYKVGYLVVIYYPEHKEIYYFNEEQTKRIS
ncbi:MAG: DUF4080 domain-containing protein [Candidatus Izemoplasmatales bacterium]